MPVSLLFFAAFIFPLVNNRLTDTHTKGKILYRKLLNQNGQFPAQTFSGNAAVFYTEQNIYVNLKLLRYLHKSCQADQVFASFPVADLLGRDVKDLSKALLRHAGPDSLDLDVSPDYGGIYFHGNSSPWRRGTVNP